MQRPSCCESIRPCIQALICKLQTSLSMPLSFVLENCQCPQCLNVVCNKASVHVCTNLHSFHSICHARSISPANTHQICLVQRSSISCKAGQLLLNQLGHNTLISTVYKSETLSLAFAQLTLKKRPSDILVFHLAPLTGKLATCKALSSSPALDMIFNGRIGSVGVKTLFDSGATNCFASAQLASTLGLTPVPCDFRAVNTANGGQSNILGTINIPSIRWGQQGLSTPVTNVLVLATFLPGIDMILGQD